MQKAGLNLVDCGTAEAPSSTRQTETTSPALTADTHQNHATSPTTSTRGSRSQHNFKTMTNKERQELVENLRDRVADIKWDVQKVLDYLDNLYHEFEPEDNE